ncbi:hypothetical protein C2G38_2162437 [Gigaspora rosea]|uniref:Uncharacterized protein n=1 Tax=Gigaspora rosea TaxID=44941 RepID=A0A397VW27_9GLOM|nr:hypothetical protein C2G38_2162437 [Gigaspora rosea]
MIYFEDKRAMIATMVLGGIIILLMIRSFITLVLMGLEANEDSHKNSHKNRNFIRYFLSPVSYLLAIGLCLPFITAFLEFYKYFGYDMDLVPSFLYDVVLFISAQTSMTFLKYTETDDSDESLIINKTNKTDSQVLYSIYKTDDKNGNYKKENTFDSFVAVVTKTYEEVLLDSYTQWTIVRAYIIALMETIFVIDSECLPYTIAYEAFNEEVEKYYNEKFEKYFKTNDYKEKFEKYFKTESKNYNEEEDNEQIANIENKMKEIKEEIQELLRKKRLFDCQDVFDQVL